MALVFFAEALALTPVFFTVGFLTGAFLATAGFLAIFFVATVLEEVAFLADVFGAGLVLLGLGM